MNLDEVRASVELLQYCQSQIAKLKEVQEIHRAAVEEALGDNEIGTLDGEEVITFKHVKSQRLDQKALKEHYPEIAEGCTVVVESRRFVVT